MAEDTCGRCWCRVTVVVIVSMSQTPLLILIIDGEVNGHVDFGQPRALVLECSLLAVHHDPLCTGGDSALNLCDNIPAPTNLNNSASDNSTRCRQTFYESKYTAPTVSVFFFFFEILSGENKQ